VISAGSCAGLVSLHALTNGVALAQALPTMAMTLTVLSLSLCGGLLSESMPSARLFAQSDEVLASPLPPERGPSRSKEALLESMPGLGGPIALIVGGALLEPALYLLPYFIPSPALLIVTIVVAVMGAVMTGVGIGTLIGNIVRRARIYRQIRRLDRGYGLEQPEPQRAAPALALLTFQLP
jgi:hypothetical protein